MFTKNGFFWKIFVLAVLLLSISLQITPAKAQTPPPEKDEPCFSCHKNLYLLRDTGKYYCLCAAKARCTFCHGGVTGTYDEKIAHQGLIANPIQQNSSVCEKCHPQDASERIAYFVAHAGVRTPMSAPPMTPMPLTAAGHLTDVLSPQPPSFWVVLVYVVLFLAAVGVALFAFRCYRQDCMRRRSN